MAELREMGLSWGEAQVSAKDRTLWRKIVVALCPTGYEDDKRVSKYNVPKGVVIQYLLHERSMCKIHICVS